jgi:hypothetical protein
LYHEPAGEAAPRPGSLALLSLARGTSVHEEGSKGSSAATSAGPHREPERVVELVAIAWIGLRRFAHADSDGDTISDFDEGSARPVDTDGDG